MEHTRWVNFYPPTGPNAAPTTSWISRHFADKNAKRGRLACVKVKFEDGDGLQESYKTEKQK